MLPELLKGPEALVGTAPEELVVSPLEILLRCHESVPHLRNKTSLATERAVTERQRLQTRLERTSRKRGKTCSSPAFLRECRRKVVVRVYPFPFLKVSSSS